MLICKNCFSENADGTIRCRQCNMEGNFIYKDPKGNKADLLLVKSSPVQCTNCGSKTPGEGATCFHCHFPLPAKKEFIDHPLNNQEFRKLKTG